MRNKWSAEEFNKPDVLLFIDDYDVFVAKDDDSGQTIIISDIQNVPKSRDTKENC